MTSQNKTKEFADVFYRYALDKQDPVLAAHLASAHPDFRSLQSAARQRWILPAPAG